MSIYFTDTLGNYLFSFTGDALYHQGDESCLRRVVMREEEKVRVIYEDECCFVDGEH